jgi:hypothetical protein
VTRFETGFSRSGSTWPRNSRVAGNDPGAAHTDFSDHIGITYDPVALQDVMNALGPDSPSFKPVCSFVPPGLG